MRTSIKMLCYLRNDVAHDVLKLFFECEKLNITTDETLTLLSEFLYPVYEKDRTYS